MAIAEWTTESGPAADLDRRQAGKFFNHTGREFPW
jgi:hypothetical protein